MQRDPLALECLRAVARVNEASCLNSPLVGVAALRLYMEVTGCKMTDARRAFQRMEVDDRLIAEPPASGEPL